MAPKPLPQKIVNYENDSFEVWLQKTNVISSEEGDLNTLHPDIYTPLPQNPDARPLPGRAYVQLSLDAVSGNFLPSKVLGEGTLFDMLLNVGDLVGISFSGLPSSHVWNDKKTYLLKVTSIISETEVLVAPVYSGPDLPTFPINLAGAEPVYVKQVNLVDSINELYNISTSTRRRLLIKAIAMS